MSCVANTRDAFPKNDIPIVKRQSVLYLFGGLFCRFLNFFMVLFVTNQNIHCCEKYGENALIPTYEFNSGVYFLSMIQAHN